jgi:hypothetical protein
LILSQSRKSSFLHLVDEAPFFALKVMPVLARRLRTQNALA